MQLTVQDVRLESQVEGPDCVKIRLTTPTGGVMDLIQDVARGDGEKWLIEQLGKGQKYHYFEARKSGNPRKPLVIVDEPRET